MLLIILCYFLSKRRIISTFNSNPSPFFYNLLWWANSFFTASASTLSHNKKRKKKYPHQNILIIVPEKFITAAKFLQNANWTPFPLFDSLSSRLIVESTQRNLFFDKYSSKDGRRKQIDIVSNCENCFPQLHKPWEEMSEIIWSFIEQEQEPSIFLCGKIIYIVKYDKT